MNTRTDLAIEFKNLSKNAVKVTEKRNIKIYESRVENKDYITVSFPDILKFVEQKK